MTIFQIEPVTIAQGDATSMQYEFEYQNKTIPDLTDYTCYYLLSPFSFEEENVLKKVMSAVPNTTNAYRVTLSSEETAALEAGTYTAKIVLEHEGNYYKKARGVFNVLKDSIGIEVTM